MVCEAPTLSTCAVPLGGVGGAAGMQNIVKNASRLRPNSIQSKVPTSDATRAKVGTAKAAASP